MADFIIDDIPEDIYRALVERATKAGHSLEDEVREILERAFQPEKGVDLGAEMASIGSDAGGSDIDR